MKKLVFIVAIGVLILSICGCENPHDTIEIYNKRSDVFDNVAIDIKDGYFYDSHEKIKVDENKIGVTIYFSNNDEDWG